MRALGEIALGPCVAAIALMSAGYVASSFLRSDARADTEEFVEPVPTLEPLEKISSTNPYQRSTNKYPDYWFKGILLAVLSAGVLLDRRRFDTIFPLVLILSTFEFMPQKQMQATIAVAGGIQIPLPHMVMLLVYRLATRRPNPGSGEGLEEQGIGRLQSLPKWIRFVLNGFRGEDNKSVASKQESNTAERQEEKK